VARERSDRFAPAFLGSTRMLSLRSASLRSAILRGDRQRGDRKSVKRARKVASVATETRHVGLARAKRHAERKENSEDN